MRFGPAIRLARAAKGLSQRELAAKIDVGPSHVSLIEAGKRQPSISTLESVANALDIPHDLLMFVATVNEAMLDDPANQPMLERFGRWLIRA